jgi:hypothetical protein
LATEGGQRKLKHHLNEKQMAGKGIGARHAQSGEICNQAGHHNVSFKHMRAAFNRIVVCTSDTGPFIEEHFRGPVAANAGRRLNSNTKYFNEGNAPYHLEFTPGRKETLR